LKKYAELEDDLQASVVTAEHSEHVPDSLPPANDSPVPNVQAAVGFQNWSTWFGKERDLLPQPGIEPCFLKFSDPNLVTSGFYCGLH